MSFSAKKFVTSSVDVSNFNPLCKAVGDPLRVEILKVLQDNSFGVLELCSIFEIGQPAMSHHLKVLSKSHLVSTKRDGANIFYQRNNFNPEENLQSFQSTLFKTINSFKLSASVDRNIESIKTAREKVSIEFFNKNVSLFQENQDLIASWLNYGPSIENLLPKHNIEGRLAVDVGSGLGDFLPTLSSLFDKVIAIDNAKEVLEECIQNITSKKLNNVSTFLGNLKEFKFQTTKADFMSLNMVLHHNINPQNVLKECSAVLAENGFMLITELCNHNQEWTKTSCGDLWYGFEPETIEKWAKECKLKKLESMFIAQRNGFKTQIHIFKK